MKKYCSDCLFGKALLDDTIMSSGWMCRKNPFKQKFKGLVGGCKTKSRQSVVSLDKERNSMPDKQTRLLEIAPEQWEEIKNADRIIISAKDSLISITAYVDEDKTDKDEYVYCTNCDNFRMCKTLPCCKYRDMCDLFDCEDSKPLYQRPMYSNKKGDN